MSIVLQWESLMAKKLANLLIWQKEFGKGIDHPKRLLSVSTNSDDFSLVNLGKFAKHSHFMLTGNLLVWSITLVFRDL